MKRQSVGKYWSSRLALLSASWLSILFFCHPQTVSASQYFCVEKAHIYLQDLKENNAQQFREGVDGLKRGSGNGSGFFLDLSFSDMTAKATYKQKLQSGKTITNINDGIITFSNNKVVNMAFDYVVGSTLDYDGNNNSSVSYLILIKETGEYFLSWIHAYKPESSSRSMKSGSLEGGQCNELP